MEDCDSDGSRPRKPKKDKHKRSHLDSIDSELRCTVPSLQSCATLPTFACMIGAFGFVQLSILAYITSMISTLEKQFRMNSSQAGYMLSGYDIAFVICTPIAAHFGRFSHRPRILGLSAMLAALCGVLSAIPQILNTNDAITSYSNASTSNSSGLLCQTNVVHVNGDTELARPDVVSDRAFDVTSFALVMAGTVVLAIGSASLSPLGMTYLDDNTESRSSAFYLAIFNASKLAGPVIGYTVGGLCARLYVNLKATPLTPDDPRWVGAWWLGFLLPPIPLVGLGVLLFIFPRRLIPPEDAEQRPEKSYKAGQCKDFFRSLGRLVKCPEYICIVLGACLFVYVISGLFAFIPKYLEIQFRVPAWISNLSVGLSGPVMGITGTLLSGALIPKLRLNALGSVMLVIVCCAGSIVTIIAMMNMDCPQTLMAGNWEHGRLSLSESCNSDCACAGQEFEPLCGADSYTYFSPCHAGCSEQTQEGKYSGCKCINGTAGEAISGVCPSHCDLFIPYVIVKAVGSLFGAMSRVPVYIAIFRIVRIEDKSLAIGMFGMCLSLLGFIPGPILFGYLMDSSCILWSEDATAPNGGHCWLYAQDDLRVKLHGTAVAFMLTGLFLFVCALIKISQRDSESRAETRKMTDASEEDYIQVLDSDDVKHTAL